MCQKIRGDVVAVRTQVVNLVSSVSFIFFYFPFNLMSAPVLELLGLSAPYPLKTATQQNQGTKSTALGGFVLSKEIQ